MKSYRNRFFILIATILLGFLIVINISKNDVKGFFNLSSMEYKDAIDERNRLYDEISILNDDNYELLKRIESLDINDKNTKENNEKVIENMRNQLSTYLDIAGKKEVKGP